MPGDEGGFAPNLESNEAALGIILQAIEKAGSLDKKAVRDAIAKSNFESLYAHVKFSENGQIDVPQIAIQIQKDEVVPIFTDHILNKPIYPVPGWDKR